MRSYRSTNLYSGTLDEIKIKVKVQLDCINLIRHLSIYIKNLPLGYEIFGVKIDHEPTSDAKAILNEYNNTPVWLSKLTGTTLIPMNNHEYWQDKFIEVCKLLNVSSKKLMSFLQTADNDNINNIKQVITEQNGFIESSDIEQFVDTYYLEIFTDTKRIISMFIRNVPPHTNPLLYSQ